MKNIIIGQYIPGSSFLYKMDPRSKIIALVLMMVSTFVLSRIAHMLILMGLVLLILKLGGIQIGRIVRGLKPIIILLMFTFVFQVLFIKTGSIVYNETISISFYTLLIALGIIGLWMFMKRYIAFKFLLFLTMLLGILAVFIYVPLGTALYQTSLTIYMGGIEGAVFIMTRLIIIVTLSTILTLTTKPTDLTLGLEQLLKPLSIVKVSAEEIALIISIALRYIPTLLDEANKIMLAQASRGVDFTEGKLKDKVVQVISLLVPMFIISFKRSDDLANAMEARSFVPGQRRTRLHQLQWQVIDTVVITTAALSIPIAILLRVFDL